MSSGIQAFNEGYVKTTWATGDVITAEKLNNIEDGIENLYNESNVQSIFHYVDSETGSYFIVPFNPIGVPVTQDDYLSYDDINEYIEEKSVVWVKISEGEDVVSSDISLYVQSSIFNLSVYNNGYIYSASLNTDPLTFTPD